MNDSQIMVLAAIGLIIAGLQLAQLASMQKIRGRLRMLLREK